MIGQNEKRSLFCALKRWYMYDYRSTYLFHKCLSVALSLCIVKWPRKCCVEFGAIWTSDMFIIAQIWINRQTGGFSVSGCGAQQTVCWSVDRVEHHLMAATCTESPPLQQFLEKVKAQRLVCWGNGFYRAELQRFYFEKLSTWVSRLPALPLK